MELVYKKEEKQENENSFQYHNNIISSETFQNFFDPDLGMNLPKHKKPKKKKKKKEFSDDDCDFCWKCFILGGKIYKCSHCKLQFHAECRYPTITPDQKIYCNNDCR